MKTRLVRIGNSRGLRLPKPLIDEIGLNDEVELEVRQRSLVIRPVDEVRHGWADAARQLGESTNSRLLDAATATRFDREEWKW